MTPANVLPPDASMMVSLVLVLLIPLAIAGLSLLNVGFGRSRSAGHAMLGSLCVLCVAAVSFVFLGSAIEGSAGQAFRGMMLDGKSWNWIGAGHLMPNAADFGSSPIWLTDLFQLFCVGLASLIPLSAGADRWRLGASCISTALLAGWMYPLFAHWVWAGGWLSQLGANYGLGSGFLDLSGASAIHAVAGIGALVVTLLLGPRRSKYSRSGIAAAIPGHNIVLVLFGCLLMLPGWMGLNAAAAILFYHLPITSVPLTAINTMLCAAGSCLTAVLVTRWRFRRPDASLGANGWVAGLVASCAASAWISPFAAAITGAVAGVLVIYLVDLLESKVRVDDPAGAVSVHAAAGIWGLLSVGIFVHSNAPGQMLAQLIGVATLLGFVLPVSYFLNWGAQRIYPYRVHEDGERQGLDLHELGAGAYPEFVMHPDD